MTKLTKLTGIEETASPEEAAPCTPATLPGNPRKHEALSSATIARQGRRGYKQQGRRGYKHLAP
ncbi:MAG TPA: hypothetical protein VH540_27520 [Ktedonobacterales bacterium]